MVLLTQPSIAPSRVNVKDAYLISTAEYEQLIKCLQAQSEIQLQLQAQLQALSALCTVLASTHPNPSTICERYMNAMDSFADLAPQELLESHQPAMKDQLNALIHIRNAAER